MDLWLWLSFYPHTWEALLVVLGRGIWFSGAHAAGNVVLALVAVAAADEHDAAPSALRARGNTLAGGSRKARAVDWRLPFFIVTW
jgi:hypothetical protein